MGTVASTLEAFQLMLEGISPAWATKKIGFPWQANPNTAYQRGTMILGKPDTVAFGDGAYTRKRGIYQIDLYSPRKDQAGPLILRGESIKALVFPNGRPTVYGAGVVDKEPFVEGQPREGDPGFLELRVEVYFYIDG